MTLYFARALAHDVRFNAACPTLITTRWFVDGIGRDGSEMVKAAYERMASLQSASTGEDIADVVAWPADGARTMTDELLLLDDGLHLGAKPVAGR